MADTHLAPLLHRMQYRKRFCSADQVVESVRANIECLLNSRLSVPDNYVLREVDEESLDLLNRSLVNFGVVDFQSLNMGDPLMEKRFCDSVKRSIERFEPRLDNVEVEMVTEKKERLINAQVRGELVVEPFEDIRFESALSADARSFTVFH